jgi:hypothetical protein
VSKANGVSIEMIVRRGFNLVRTESPIRHHFHFEIGSLQHANVFLADDFSQMNFEFVISRFDSLQFDDHFGSDRKITISKSDMGILLVC